MKKLIPTLGYFDATMIVAGSMIGSGIFIVTADIARTVGSSGWVLAVWILTGIITLFAALSYGELAGMMPQAGGQFVYIRRAYNPLIAFMYGWTVFLVIQTGVIAAVAVAFARFTAVFFPWFSTSNVLVDLGFAQISGGHLLAVFSIFFLSGLNIFGVKNGKIIQGIFTSAKLIALLGLIGAGIYFGMGSGQLSQNFSNAWDAKTLVNGTFVPVSGWSILTLAGVAMIGSLFSSDAWNNVTFIAGEIKDPKRNIPLSLLTGTMIVTVIYVLANIAYLSLLPVTGEIGSSDITGKGISFAENDRVGTAAASIIFGDLGAFLMAGLIMVSTFGCNNGLILSGSRLYYAMAKEGLFFSGVAKLNKYNVPALSILIQAVWASVLCLSGTYGDLLDYATFAALIFYIVTIAGIFILRKKEPDTPRPYKAFGYPYIPVIYIILTVLICADLLYFKTRNTGIGLLIVLLGIPVYYLSRSRNKPITDQ